MIKAGHVFTTENCAEVEVLEVSRDDVRLTIPGPQRGHSAYFGVEDLKQLRKFLKKLQRQLEGKPTI